jgi:hypothetical protein
MEQDVSIADIDRFHSPRSKNAVRAELRTNVANS